MQFLKKYSQHIIYLFIGLFIFTTFFVMFVYYKGSDSWTTENFDLKINDTNYKDIDINTFPLPHLKKGDDISLKCFIKKSNQKHKFLVFKTYSSTVEVLYNNKKIYSYGKDLKKKGHLLGRGYHIVLLKDLNKKNIPLKIKLKSDENLNYKWLSFIKFSSDYNVWSNIFDQNLNSVSISILLFLTGIIGFFSCFIAFYLLNIQTGHLLYSFATAFFIGLWNMCTNGLFQKLTGSMELVALFEYLSLYITPFFYVNIINLIKGKNKFSKIFFILKIFYVVFVMCSLALHIMNKVPMSYFVNIFRTITMIGLVIVLFLILNHYEEQKKYEKVLSIGTLISAGMIITESALLNVNIHVITIFHKDYEIGDLFTSLSILIIVITPLISYSINANEMRKYETQINLLTNMAFKDNLTGLYNRYKGMANIMELKKESSQYHLIVFDLNNLKTTNDTLGHKRGDKLLIDFSNCLKITFSDENCTCIRQGGDEFIVILKNVSVINIHNYINRLMDTINAFNYQNNDGCDIEVAYGIAGSNESPDGDYDTIFRLADKRMYLKKMEMKGEL